MLTCDMETIIRFDRENKGAEIYTSDPVWMRKLDRMCERSDHYRHNDEQMDTHSVATGERTGAFYLLDDKTLISLRAAKKVLTEEQRAAAVDRLSRMK